MSQGNVRIPKISVEVELTLIDGQVMTGQVFILATQRVLDLLNAVEPFLPFRRQGSGEVILLNKAAIAVARPLDHRD